MILASNKQLVIFVGLHDNDDDNNTNNNNNKNYGIGLPHAQGYYDDDNRSTDEGMHRIKPGH